MWPGRRIAVSHCRQIVESLTERCMALLTPMHPVLGE
jgi:hypothetical protein